MVCSRRFGHGVLLLAAVAALACQQLPSGSDEFGDGGDDDGTGGSTTFADDEDDDGDEADTGTESGQEGDDGDPMLECDPVAQTDCGEGEKCTVVESAGELTYTCVADAQSLDPFGPCTPAPSTGMDSCPAGHACFADDLGNGLCVPLCLGNNDCQNALCISPPTSLATYCAPECSPFEPTCPMPMQCRRGSDRFVCEFGRSGDTGVGGDQCSLDDDRGCSEGHVCLPGELVPECTFGACCTRVCDTNAADTCESPSICEELFASPAPGNETIGACFVPA